MHSLYLSKLRITDIFRGDVILLLLTLQRLQFKAAGMQQSQLMSELWMNICTQQKVLTSTEIQTCVCVCVCRDNGFLFACQHCCGNARRFLRGQKTFIPSANISLALCPYFSKLEKLGRLNRVHFVITGRSLTVCLTENNMKKSQNLLKCEENLMYLCWFHNFPQSVKPLTNLLPALCTWVWNQVLTWLSPDSVTKNNWIIL